MDGRANTLKAQIYSMKVLKNQNQKRRTRKILKTLKNHKEEMSGHVNIRISKIMRTPIKVGICTDVTYASC